MQVISDNLRRWGAVACAGALCGCATIAADYPASDHYTDGRFHNVGTYVEPVATRRDWRRHIRRMLNGHFADADDLPANHVLTADGIRAGLGLAERSDFAVTWLGHATALIRMGGKWIMTDPVLLDTIGGGPFRVERHQPARPELEDLPTIDAIVISHADYDHLDLPSIRRLARRNPDARVYVPLGVGRLIRQAGFARIVEMDWYQTEMDGGLTIEAVPAIHGTRRTPHRRNSMLWAGWILRAGGDSLYFAGDTGFGSLMTEMAGREAPVDVALVPIGAWSPRWFQAPFHVDPEEAVRLAQLIGARTAIGIHWGTFALSEEAPTEQKQRFLAARAGRVEVIAPRIGETVIVRGRPPD